MDKITFVLQEKQTIENLVKDPEVRIKIADAVTDAIGKRAIKLMNANAEIEGTVKTIANHLSNEIKKQYFEGTGYYGNNTLRSDIKAKITSTIHSEITNEMYKQILQAKKDLDNFVKSQFDTFKEEIANKLNSIDIESVIRQEAQKIISDKFNH